MFSVITDIYIKKIFDVCTTGDTAHIDTIFKFLPHTQQLEYRIDVCRVTRGANIEHL
jgi:hypothetical protein